MPSCPLSQMNERPRDGRQSKVDDIFFHLEVLSGVHDDPFLMFKGVASRRVILVQGADRHLPMSILFRQHDAKINGTLKTTVDRKYA